MIVRKGIVITDDVLRQVREYRRKHYQPVIVTDNWTADPHYHVRKGTRSVRTSESIVFDKVETARIATIRSE